MGLLVSMAGVGFSISRLGSEPISPLSLVWIVLLLLALPLALWMLYRLYGLLTASYRVDRDGLYIRWGISFEQVPLDLITEVGPLREGEPHRPRPGLWWPGCMVGSAETGSGDKLDYFATSARVLAIRTSTGRIIVISPADSDAFQGAILSATRMGSLESIPERSQRADFLITRLWSDGLARGLILTGLLIPLLLLGTLVILAPSLPELVPFGFNRQGEPTSLAPPGRLLLLPMIASLIWIADLILGAWFFGEDADRPVAYALWGTAILAGTLLAGATWRLLSI